MTEVRRTALCPTCGHTWDAESAPWIKQRLHCPKHDRVFMAGTTCEFCDQEAASAQVDSSGDNSVVVSQE